MYENEILVLLLGSVVLGFVFSYQKALICLPFHKILVAAFTSLLVAWLSTNLEHIAFATFFNYLEHFSYAINGVLLLAWCYLGLRGDS